MPTASGYPEARRMILFGEDLWGYILYKRGPYKNTDGEWMIQFLIQPDPDLVREYPELQDERRYDYKSYGVWKEYPEYWVIEGNHITRVLCTFNGRETIYTQLFEKYTRQIEGLWKEMDARKLSILYLREELKIALENPASILEMIRRISDKLKGGIEYEPKPEEPEEAKH